MAPRRQSRSVLSGNLAAPAVIGLGYGLVRALPDWESWGGWNLQGPFAFSVLSGVVVALGCRPVLARIPWSRWMVFGLALALLVATGPMPGWGLMMLAGWLGVEFLSHHPGGLWPEILGAVTAAGLMALFYGMGAGEIGMSSIRARLASHSPKWWGGRLAALGGWATLVWLALGWADALRGPSAGALVAPNPFFLAVSALGGSGASGVGGGWLMLGGLWLRGMILYSPLLVIFLAVRGSLWQLTLVFAMLLFVVGEFAPLMMDQPFTSTTWLLQRVGLGLGRAVLLAGAAAWLVGLPKLKPVGD